jgi:glycosyltransferase involved in cell wall biosynthesis
MTAPRGLVCWQPVLTDHQAFTYEALSKLVGTPMVAHVSSMEDALRKAQGWSDTQVSSIERRVIPARSAMRYCYAQLKEHRLAVHFFGSPFQQPRLMVCLALAMCLGIEFYLVSEPYSSHEGGYLKDESSLLSRCKVALRPVAYRFYALCLRKRMAGIFAISHLSMAQYKAAGVPAAKLFPFGYFVPASLPITEPRGTAPESAGLKLIYVGALIQRKGLELLADAVREVIRSGRNIRVDVYGPGEVPSYLKQAPGIATHAPIPFGRTGSVIADYDLLVLPSHYDGWGVVVNEALCVGVPVVTSDAAGAGRVAAELGAGITFVTGDSKALAKVLNRLIDDIHLRNSLTLATSAAAKLLEPEVAARYMWEVVQAPAAQKSNVPSPWYPPHAD